MNPESTELSGLFLINVKQRLSTVALNSIAMNLSLPAFFLKSGEI